MAIANRAESAIFKGLGIFAESTKSFGFGFGQEKIKPNIRADLSGTS